MCHHIETSQLICGANELTGFYMLVTLAFNELKLTWSQQNIKLRYFLSLEKTWMEDNINEICNYYLINDEVINHITTLRDLRLMSSTLVSKKNGKA